MPDKQQSLIRAFYLMLIIICFSTIFIYEWQKVKHEQQVKQTLRQVHAGLQNYHVKFEAYVPGPKMKLSGLIFHLHKSGYLANIPLNPYTGKPFQANDSNDYMTYETDEKLATFKLKAFNKNMDDVIYSMESNGLGKMSDDQP